MTTCETCQDYHYLCGGKVPCDEPSHQLFVDHNYPRGKHDWKPCPSCSPQREDSAPLNASITHHEAGLHGICDESQPCKSTPSEDSWDAELFTALDMMGLNTTQSELVRQRVCLAVERARQQGRVEQHAKDVEAVNAIQYQGMMLGACPVDVDKANGWVDGRDEALSALQSVNPCESGGKEGV